MKGRIAARIGRIVLIVIVAALALGFIVMQLWNGIVPDLFHGPALSYWQAIGILLLSRLLFFSGPGGRFGGRRGPWRGRFRERWEAMTPEQREEMRAQWGGHCGWRGVEEDKVGAERA